MTDPGIRPLTAGQEAELASIQADQEASQARWQATRARWRANIERREQERTLERGRRLPDPKPWPPDLERRLVPKRLRTRVPCTAHRSDGQPCGAWAIHGGWVCAAHGGRAPQTRAAARRRLLSAGITAYLLESSARLAQAREEAAELLGRLGEPDDG